MKDLISVDFKKEPKYDDNSKIKNFTDYFGIYLGGKGFIEDLNLTIPKIYIPFNINKLAYNKNIKTARKISKCKNGFSSSNINNLNYHMLNLFQKKTFSYSVAYSMRLILRKNHKNINDASIVIYDVEDEISKDILCEIAKYSKYIIIISSNINKALKLRDYVSANYGVCPIITRDFKNAFLTADFIITSRKMDFKTKAYIWSLDSLLDTYNENVIISVSYSVPWRCNNIFLNVSLIGAILNNMGEKDVGKAFISNDIILSEIIMK
ncbi:MAG: hypothetical protein ACERKV_06615 [Clostridiaceae bacterium]